MQLPDLINGTFELLAAAAVLNNCWTVWQHKQVRGVSIASTAFFLIWGLWNCFYYPHLDQFFSFAGGIAITIANVIYVALLVRYRSVPPVFFIGRPMGDGTYEAVEADEHAIYGGYQDFPFRSCNHYGVATSPHSVDRP